MSFEPMGLARVNMSLLATDTRDGWRQGVRELENYNYIVKAENDTGDDIHVSSGVVVPLGDYTDLPDAIRELRLVAKRMEADLKSSGLGKALTAASR